MTGELYAGEEAEVGWVVSYERMELMSRHFIPMATRRRYTSCPGGAGSDRPVLGD